MKANKLILKDGQFYVEDELNLVDLPDELEPTVFSEDGDPIFVVKEVFYKGVADKN